MKNPKIQGYSYSNRRPKAAYIRVVAELLAEDVYLLDQWGVRHGLPSRTAVIRRIVEDIIKKEKAPGSHQASPDASTQLITETNQ